MRRPQIEGTNYSAEKRSAIIAMSNHFGATQVGSCTPQPKSVSIAPNRPENNQESHRTVRIDTNRQHGANFDSYAKRRPTMIRAQLQSKALKERRYTSTACHTDLRVSNIRGRKRLSAGSVGSQSNQWFWERPTGQIHLPAEF